MKSERSAGGVVYRHTEQKTQILFVLDPYRKWALPKGHIEPGESREEAALREVEEETGVPRGDLRIVGKIGKLKYRFTFNGQKIRKKVYFYLLEAVTEAKVRPQPAEKITAVKWVNVAEAIDFSGYKNAQKIIRRGIALLVDNL